MTALPPLPQGPGSPWQWLYTAAHRARWRWYATRARRLERPVISVGNLHWGGAGKTPLVAAVARQLTASGRRTAILSRGYGRQGKDPRVVSTGDGPMLGPRVAGDEPVLLAGELPGVAVVVGADRYRAGRLALEHLDPPPEVLLLDDGFSHLGLFRDIDLLAFPHHDPLARGRLLPGGRLREPLAAMSRADAAVWMEASGEEARQLGDALAAVGFDGPMFGCTIEPQAARLTSGEPLAPGTRVLTVAAIARPQRFETAAREAGFRIAEVLTFADHHPYPERSLKRIRRQFRRTAAEAVLTTSKDRVKLLGRLDLPLAELPIVAQPEPALWGWLDRRLEQQIAELEA